MTDVISARVDGSWTIASRPPSGDVPSLASPPLAWARFFQAISLRWCRGMPAGIGLPLMLSQAYPAADAKAPGTPLENIAGVPGLVADTFADPQALVAVGVGMAVAESLFTAAAVDRMHDGPRTRYNPELVAQGAGNTLAGLLGALPVTAVVARSSANVQGARRHGSRASCTARSGGGASARGARAAC